MILILRLRAELWTYPHNLVPDLESSSDTVKDPRPTRAGLLPQGHTRQARKETGTAAPGRTTGTPPGDLTITPVKNLAIFFKYRHYDLTAENPDTVTITGLNPVNTYTYNVRDSISSQKDIMTGTIRYRTTDRLTLKGDYSVEKIQREVGTAWEVAPETTKSTTKLRATYRAHEEAHREGRVQPYRD